MPKIKVYPKESEREWFLMNYTASNFNWSDALKNGFWFYTTNTEASMNKYAGKCESIEIIN